MRRNPQLCCSSNQCMFIHVARALQFLLAASLLSPPQNSTCSDGECCRGESIACIEHPPWVSMVTVRGLTVATRTEWFRDDPVFARVAEDHAPFALGCKDYRVRVGAAPEYLNVRVPYHHCCFNFQYCAEQVIRWQPFPNTSAVAVVASKSAHNDRLSWSMNGTARLSWSWSDEPTISPISDACLDAIVSRFTFQMDIEPLERGTHCVLRTYSERPLDIGWPDDVSPSFRVVMKAANGDESYARFGWPKYGRASGQCTLTVEGECDGLLDDMKNSRPLEAYIVPDYELSLSDIWRNQYWNGKIATKVDRTLLPRRHE